MAPDGQHGRRRSRIIDRIVALRRQAEGPAIAVEQSAPAAEEPPAADVETLRRRVEHLESVLEGLQDSVHRETARLETQIQELRHRIDARSLSRDLEADARKRGL